MADPIATKPVVLNQQDEKKHRDDNSRAINTILQGKINSTENVTLTASVATTTLSDSRIGSFSKIFFMPTTANAATGLTVLFVTSIGQGSATLNHANNAQTDRTYGYVILG